MESKESSVYLSFLNKFSSNALRGQAAGENDIISLNDRIEGLNPDTEEYDRVGESNQSESMRTSFNIIQPNNLEEEKARGLFYKKQDKIRELVLDIVDKFVELNKTIISKTEFS